MRPLIWLDLETTGLDERAHEIIEFAAHRTTDGAEICFKINPEHPETASPEALEVTGYTPEKWAAAGAISLEEALHKIVEFCEGFGTKPNPAGQNVTAFDLRFLQAAFRDHKVDWPFHYHNIDTMVLAYEHLKPIGQKSISLHNVCTTLGISNEGEHTALADVRRTIAVYQKLCRATWWDRFNWKRAIRSQS